MLEKVIHAVPEAVARNRFVIGLMRAILSLVSPAASPGRKLRNLFLLVLGTVFLYVFLLVAIFTGSEFFFSPETSGTIAGWVAPTIVFLIPLLLTLISFKQERLDIKIRQKS